MRTRFARIITALGFALVALLAVPTAFAQPVDNTPREPIKTEIQVPISTPELVPASEDRFRTAYLTEGKVEDLAQYIGIIYNFLISIVGLVAAVVMIVGGFQYLTSAGDSSRIGAAKSRMANAFIGMVLALGAYTILNTINPALLRLKLPDFRAVKTVIFTLPTCEDLIAAGTPVAAYGSETECGNAGKYAQGNNKEQVCIFAGSCRLNLWDEKDGDEDFGHDTCLQRGDMESETIKAELKLDPNKSFAECISCAELNLAKTRALHFPDPPTACLAWQQAFDSVPQSFKTYKRGGYTVENGLFYQCLPNSKNTVCLGIPLFCWDITRDDDTFNDNEGWVGNGCQGYDENPSVLVGENPDSNGFFTRIREGRNCNSVLSVVASPVVGEADSIGLECFPVHLGTVCANNPCLKYADPTDGRQAFRDGCKNSSGTAFAIARVFRHGDIGAVKDCRCQVKDIEGGGCTGD